MKKKILRLSAALFLLLFIVAIMFLMRSSIPSDEELLKLFSFENSETKLGYFEAQNRRVRFIKISRDEEIFRPTLVMVHGAPGGINGFELYAQDSSLRARFNMLIYERPGYGISDIRPEERIENHAAILLELIDNQTDRAVEVAFLSHSYGGAIAALASSRARRPVLGHVMVAPVLDGLSEPVFWFSNLPSKWLIRDLVAQEWYTSSVEKMTHEKALQEVMPYWSNVNCQTIHFHGSDDWLAPPDNIDFVKAHFPQRFVKSIVLENRSHFILWTEDTFFQIREAILTL